MKSKNKITILITEQQIKALIKEICNDNNEN